MIPRNPIFLKGLFRIKKAVSLPYPLDTKESYLYGYARAALYEGLKLLEIKTGENILVPDYICNAALSPLHKLGINPKFYGLNNDLSPRWGALEKTIDKNTRGLIVVNYFGFPNDLARAKEFCRQQRIFLIEDNAHGFLSSNQDRALGSYGDISIFSLRKTLPLPNAAALMVNNDSLKERVDSLGLYLKKERRTSRFLIRGILESIGYYFKIMPPLYGKKNNSAKTSLDVQEEFNLDKYLVACSRLSKFIIEHTDMALIILQRRKAYSEWHKFFQEHTDFNAKIMFSGLPDKVVPYVFPVLVEKQKEFILTMRKNGVDCFLWPFLPEKSDEQYFSRHIVCLPLTVSFKAADLNKRICKQRQLNWEEIEKRPNIRLYAGDLPKMPEYEGFAGLSITKSDSRHIFHDITKSFPLTDSSVDIFQAEDVFEHIDFNKLPGIVNEIYRILKPSGLFRLSVPDYNCELLYKRSIKDRAGSIIFDPAGGGTPKNPGHRWFPRISQVRELLEKSSFKEGGIIKYLHYYNNDGTYVTEKIDYSQGYIQRTPDNDQRVKYPYRPMSMIIDLIKKSAHA